MSFNMTFVHNFEQFEELSTTTVDGRRMYNTPYGPFPSVTTVLSEYNKDALDEWKARVGEEEAKKVAFQASTRGSAVHDMAERLLKNEQDPTAGYSYFEKDMFLRLKPHLVENIGEIKGIEVPLYSKLLKTAGRVDLVAYYKGKLSIIDFKTSTKAKKKDWIKSYFMQCAAYATMFYELTGLIVPQIVVIIVSENINMYSTDDNGEPQVFVEKAKDHIMDFKKLRDEYDRIHAE